jgi:hypothetical protein
MLLRSYFTTTGRPLKHFTVDAHASAAFSAVDRPKQRPRNSRDILFESHKGEFGEKKLLEWLDSISFPYPGKER